MRDSRPQPNRLTADIGSFLVEVFYTPPHTRAPFHVHDQITVVVPLSGYFLENTFQKRIEGKPGAVIVETPQSPHENVYGPYGGTNLRLRMSPEIQSFIELAPNARSGHTRAFELARNMATNMGDPLLLECAALEVLGIVHHGEDWTPRCRPKFLREIITHLRAVNLQPDIATISRDMHVSPIRLARAFRRTYGISLARFMRVLQLRRAVNLLSDRTLSLSAVAAASGFSDQSHMTRAFAQTYGATPLSIRRQKTLTSPRTA